jgi:hypothetical protein
MRAKREAASPSDRLGGRKPHVQEEFEEKKMSPSPVQWRVNGCCGEPDGLPIKRYKILPVHQSTEDSAESRLPVGVDEVLETPRVGPAQVNPFILDADRMGIARPEWHQGLAC